MPSRALTFLQEIREAIDGVDRLIAVLGPGAARSDYVRAEWQYALTVGKVVTPLLRLGTYDLVPPELRNLHCLDFRPARAWDQGRAELLRILRDPLPQVGPVVGAPEPPPRFQPRPDDLARLARTVLIDLHQPVVVTSEQRVTVLHGMGGVGKSVLAASFAYATETRRAFVDGAVWLRLGQSPELGESMNRLLQLLTGERRDVADVQDASVELKRVLAQGRYLIILDDVWDTADVVPFSNSVAA
jgi:hypothetical protein